MVVFLDLLFFTLSCLALVVAGGMLVRSLPTIAVAFRMSPFLLSFVLMAVSTSLPELFVGITSAREGNSALALGTVIGSNIANLTLIGGLSIILARGFKTSKIARKDSWMMLLLAVLPVILMVFDYELSRLDGAILLIVFALYMIFLLAKRETEEFRDKIKIGKLLLSFLGFIAGLFLLFYSAKYAVKYASLLAFDMMMPPILIGIFFLALGTSLPELIFSTIAVRKKQSDLVLGNLIGSVIANSTLILGVTAIIQPITANFLLYLTSSVFMIAIIFLFTVFLDTGRELSWKEGMALVIFYVLFLLIELNIPRTVL